MAALKYVLALLLIAGSWALWHFLGLPLWAAIAITVSVVVGLIVWVLLAKRREKKAAAQIEEVLRRQGNERAGNIRPDMRAQVEALQGEFDAALTALKASKLGTSALTALPWYVMIGPPGSGKTTAIRNSGLDFPFTRICM